MFCPLLWCYRSRPKELFLWGAWNAIINNIIVSIPMEPLRRKGTSTFWGWGGAVMGVFAFQTLANAQVLHHLLRGDRDRAVRPPAGTGCLLPPLLLCLGGGGRGGVLCFS